MPFSIKNLKSQTTAAKMFNELEQGCQTQIDSGPKSKFGCGPNSIFILKIDYNCVCMHLIRIVKYHTLFPILYGSSNVQIVLHMSVSCFTGLGPLIFLWHTKFHVQVLLRYTLIVYVGQIKHTWNHLAGQIKWLHGPNLAPGPEFDTPAVSANTAVFFSNNTVYLSH